MILHLASLNVLMGVPDRAYPRISREYIMVIGHLSPVYEYALCILGGNPHSGSARRVVLCDTPRYAELYLKLSVSLGPTSTFNNGISYRWIPSGGGPAW